MVRSALRANVARPAGSAFVSSARIASTARTPFVASCHQCGSSSSRFTESIRLTTSASPPALSITSFSHWSTSPPERKTTVASATAATSLGRGS